MVPFRTRHGTTIDMTALQPDEIVTSDMLERLAKLNRWCGETRHPWSVAAHSLMMYDEAKRRGIDDPRELRSILLHDAHEAFVQDVPKPIKESMYADRYTELCEIVQRPINLKYDCDPHGYASVAALDEWSREVEYAELIYPAIAGREDHCAFRSWWHDFLRIRQVADTLGVK